MIVTEIALPKLWFLVWVLAGCCTATGQETPGQETAGQETAGQVNAVPSPLPERELPLAAVRTAIANAIEPLQHGSAVSANERQCFTCHNQALPVLALAEVAKRGFEIDRQNFQRQLQHTWDHLERGRKAYQQGKGQGGQVMTAGYAMWTLEAGDWPPDQTTAAVAHYLTEYQKDKNHWLPSSKRLPSSGSGFTATYLALRALSQFATEPPSDALKARRQAAANWVLTTQPRDTEDHVFRLRTLPYIDAGEITLGKAVAELLSRQHANGGWSQSDIMEPDAYATGTVMAALQQIGGLAGDHPAIVAGCRYLVDSQLSDGTWHVVTHAKPIQDYYESGFPHEEDQFISISASSWATLALALTILEPTPR